ncbi:c-type cytochrome [Phenylobacterium hankyongense]|uniref:c-type cytochrome n=1 Tax=Phenylobacterium hankyongense TaxID=1813876 RepID=UPI001057C8AA|nr:cytochrome c [Phenylobacterium hankyongense]
MSLRSFLPALAAALLVAGAAVAQPAAAPEPPGANLLPPGDGRDLAVRTCSACHALEIVAQKRLDQDGWYEIVQMMHDRGAQGSDDQMAQIATYLAKAFPATAAGAAAPAAHKP